MSKFQIVNNTDSVDIDQKCIGLDVRRESIPRDVMDHVNANRGLHIQIRHNRDAQAFAQANEVARLLAAAPELLEALKRIIASAPITGLPLALEKDIQSACAVVAKAEAKS